MTTDIAILAKAAERAESDPFYLASAFKAWREANATDLAAHLGISTDRLPRLALCKRPRDRAEVAQLAAWGGCDVDRLAEVCGI